MDDTDFKKQRTSLLVLSLGIILYVLGDGSIGENGGIFGSTIIFQNPHVLEVAGFLSFLWFVWRYVITGRKALRGYLAHYKLNLYFNPEYGAILSAAFSKLPKEAPKYDDISAILNRHNKVWASPSSIGDNYESGALPPFVKNLLWPNKFHYYINKSYTIWTTHTSEIDDGMHENAFTPHGAGNDESYEFNAPVFKLFWLELKVLLSTALKKKQFSDIVAPLIFAGAAFILLIMDWLCIV